MYQKRALTAFVFGVLLVVALPVPTGAQAQLGRILEAQKRPTAQAMRQAARRARVDLNLRSLAQGTGNGASVVIGVVNGLEEIPATELPNGVIAAFAYLDLPGGRGGVQPNLAAGFYSLRVTASLETVEAALAASGGVPPDTTTIEGRPGVPGAEVELINARGRVVRVIPALLGAFSLDLPPDDGLREPAQVEPTIGARYINVWIVCPNGWAVCLQVSWLDFFTYFS